ncbi:MAG TPA: hypothetical protein VEV43_01920, partial [Actinomycetota bacterium]|nr:hypothetical protein [Actinomycetota bacterium]
MTVDDIDLKLTTRYETDLRGNVTEIIDPRGVRHEYIYNEVDWLVEERVAASGSSDGAPPLSLVTKYLYDENGNVIEKQEPFGEGGTISTRWSHGLLNEVRSVDRELAPGGETAHESYEYDPNLNVTRAVDAEGRATSFAYDERDLVVTRTLESATDDPITITYTYDAEGQQTQMTDGRGGLWKTEYDGYSRVKAQIDPAGTTT